MKTFSRLLQVMQSQEYVINFLIVLGYPMLFMTYGLDFTDGPWNVRMSQMPGNFMPYWFTAETGYYWVSVFGDSMISYRWLNYILIELIFFIFCFSFFHNKDKRWFSRYAVVAMILTVRTMVNNFNYTTSTVLCLSVLFICLIKFVNTKKSICLVIAGFISVLAMAARFPNIVIIPAFLMLLGIFVFLKQLKYHDPGKNKFLIMIRLWSVYLGACLLTFVIFSVFVFPCHDYFAKVFESLYSYAHSEKYHSLNHMLTAYGRDIIVIIKFLAILLFMNVLFGFVAKYVKINKLLAGFVFAGLYIFILIKVSATNTNFGYNLNLTAVTLFIISFLFYHFYRQEKYVHLFLLIALTIFMFIPAIGSNTGFIKCKAFASIIIIFLLYWLSREKAIARVQQFFFTMVMLALISHALYCRFSWAYGESQGMGQFSYTINHEKLRSIRTSCYRKELAEKIIQEVKILTSHHNDIVFFGPGGQMFYYLLEKQSLPDQLFYLEPDDRVVIKQLKAVLAGGKEHPAVAILYGNPDIDSWPQNLYEPGDHAAKAYVERSRNLIGLLSENSYRKVIDDKAFLFMAYDSMRCLQRN